MKLADLQSAFQDALLKGGSDILEHIPDSAREKKDVLFGVYRNAYVIRLRGILREDFERVHTYVGDDAFDELARAFIAAHPSQTLNARYYAQAFPQFVREAERYKAVPMVAAMARLESLLNEVFDTADAEPLSLTQLSAFAPEDFANIRFTPHPSARRLSAPAGLEAIFSALSQEQPPPAPGQGVEHLLVWRKDVVPHYRILPDEEAMMWDEAAKGVPFGVLCEMLATFDDPSTAAVRAAGYLQSWITNGLLLNAALQG